VSTRRRLCRAIACPRHVDDGVLFCNVHWVQLPPKLVAPIAGNKEAPTQANPDASRSVISGTLAAVAYLAKKEGRARDLQTAKQTQAIAPAQGGTTAVAGSGSSPEPSEPGTWRYDRYDRR
jgi:hypothetical protein